MDPRLLTQLEQKYGFTPGLLNAVMLQESGGKADAVSPKGARGWFQFMPDTAEEWGVDDPTDFGQAARGAAAYLNNLKSQFGSEEDALAAYNWGQGNLRKFKAGKVKAMPEETVNYVSSIRGKLGTGTTEEPIPELEDEIPELPDEIPELDAPKSDKPEKIDWQSQLDQFRLTTILPTVGGMAGAAGGAFVPNPGGPVVGGAVGGLAGAMLGHAAAIAPSPAPIEEKLKYLARQTGFESAMAALGMKAPVAVAAALARTPAEKIAVEQWFAQQGSKLRPLTDTTLSPKAHSTYKAAQKEMNEVVDTALGDALNSLQRGNSPTQAGKVYQEAYNLARTEMNKQHDVLFREFEHGETIGALRVKPTPEAIEIAKKALKYMEDAKTSNKGTSVGPDIRGILEDVAAGKEVPMATLHTQKRVLADGANWEAYGKSVDNHVRKTLSTALDTSIEESLPKNLRTRYQRANQIAYNNLDLMNATFVKKLASADDVDPMEVASFVAQHASPTTVNEFKRSMGFMVRRGALKSEQAGMLMDHVRRNWIEQNMNNHTKAADMYEALLGKGADAETLDSFNAVFQGSPVRETLMKAARASHAVRMFGENIPASTGAGPGTYMTVGSVASLPFTVAGSYGAAAFASTASIATLFLHNFVPKLVASQKLTHNTALRNKVSALSSYFGKATPEDYKRLQQSGIMGLPPAMQSAYADIVRELEDE